MTTFPAASIRPDYTPHARAERLIAAGRFVLAFFSLIAIYLEPSTPAKYQQATYTLLLIYTLYALGVVIAERRSARPWPRWQIASHVADVILFSVFIYLTEGPASPFFLYFVFSLFCAMLRFSWRGILATGVAAMAIYAVMAIIVGASGLDLELNRVLIREAYLAVIAALLVYLGMYEQRLRGELTSLAAWPRELASEIDAVLQATLAHAASVLQVPKVLLLWEESEEPWVYVAVSESGRFQIERLSPGTLEPIGCGELRNKSFFVRAPDAPVLLYDPVRSSVEETATQPLGAACRLRYGVRSAIVVSLESETVTSQLVVPDMTAATADDLALAYVVGRLALATLEQFLFVQQVRMTASAEERLRISRELHDGIVQSLGGAGLQLQVIRKQLPSESVAAERLGHVQRVIEHDQRELRALVRELRPHDPREGAAILADELQRMRERFSLEWGLAVELDTDGPVAVPPRLANELGRILNESLSNAARHGGATRATVSLDVKDGVVLLRVRDNGRGFPFSGTYDLDSLTRTGSGPRTLKERVAALGGSLVVDSSPSGAAIAASIPIPAEART